MGRLRLAFVLNGSAFLLMFGVGLTVALLPQRVIALSGSFTDVGILASAFALPFVLLQIPVGRLADRYGFRMFLTAGYLFCGLAGIAYCFADTPLTIFMGRILQGVGEVPVWALAPALLSIQYSERKGNAIGSYNASIHLGLTAGSLVGLMTFDIWKGNEAFWMLSAMSFGGALLIALGMGKHHLGVSRPIPRTGKIDIVSIVGNYRTLAILAGITLYGCGYGIFLTVIPATMIDAESFGSGLPGGSVAVGLFFVLFYVALSLAQFFGGRLSDRVGHTRIIVCGLIITAVCLVIAPLLHHLGRLVFLALASLGLGVFCVAAMAYLNECVPVSLRGTISGAFYLFWGMGFFGGPLLLGKLADRGDFKLGIFIFAGLLFSEVVVLLLTVQKRFAPVKP